MIPKDKIVKDTIKNRKARDLSEVKVLENLFDEKIKDAALRGCDRITVRPMASYQYDNVLTAMKPYEDAGYDVIFWEHDYSVTFSWANSKGE
jgi:hypothetical protein